MCSVQQDASPIRFFGSPLLALLAYSPAGGAIAIAAQWRVVAIAARGHLHFARVADSPLGCSSERRETRETGTGTTAAFGKLITITKSSLFD